MIEHAQPLNWTLSPVEALRRYPADQLITLLHSGRFDARWARWSILQHADEAFRLETDREGKPRASWLQHDGEVREVPVNKPFAALRTALRSGSGLWTGYLGYDLGRWIEHLPRKASERSDWPVVQMQHAPGWLVHDGSTGRWYACGAWRESGYPDLPNLPVDDSSFAAELAAPQFTRGDYEARVQTVKDYIAAGDVFQVNVAQQLSADCTGNTRALYASLAEVSPAWYGAHVELLAAESEPHRTLASISPELFLSLKNGHVITRPIKGTRPASV
ncbi:MAG: chorismate-binding protein, partial [Rhodospirillales bacterium]|nr:chorismate-binding protein [Rhodospirillales bacterium]